MSLLGAFNQVGNVAVHTVLGVRVKVLRERRREVELVNLAGLMSAPRERGGAQRMSQARER